ncbi:MAG: YdeI/OmpD-associated family protein [Chitinophagaceae bacterium]|nr:YdeI/OmpD-associated family protein [Chitinophagaceae bacterium]
MSTTDPRIDAYINKATPFAQPILHHIRQLVHKACPQVEETIKWSFPHFDYKGILCSMAAMKQHCSFGFWKASLMADPEKLLNKIGNTSMGSFGKIASINDLPSDKILISYIKEAVRLNEEDVKLPPKERTAKKDVEVPGYMTSALSKNKKAQSAFDNFSPSHKREYIEWINDAKTEATRNKRIGTMLEWLAEGKSLNWKYQR